MFILYYSVIQTHWTLGENNTVRIGAPCGSIVQPPGRATFRQPITLPNTHARFSGKKPGIGTGWKLLLMAMISPFLGDHAKTPPTLPVTPSAAVAEAPPTTFYALHSGLNDPDNSAANRLQQELLSQGVAKEQVIVMDNPYTAFTPAISDTNLFYWRFAAGYSSNVYNNVSLYYDSASPESEVVQAQAQQLKTRLAEKGIRPQDKVVWIGHSAGGQMGLTLAHLMSQQPDEAFRIDRVVTLGSPIHENHAPQQTEIISFVSNDDLVLQASSQWRNIHSTPPNLDNNDKVVNLDDVGHAGYYANSAALEQVLTEAGIKVNPVLVNRPAKPPETDLQNS